MFDKLIVSEPDRTEVQHRRSYFMVSTVVVGILFITAVVISIYAEDFGLGSGSLELVEIITPPNLAEAVAPQPIEKPRPANNNSNSERTIRRDNIQNPAETPDSAPPISVVPSAAVARPIDLQFDIGLVNSGPVNSNGTGRDGSATDGPSGSGGLQQSALVAADVERDTTPPPPVPKKDVPKPPVSKGVVNGMAKDLPKPDYSAAARSVGAQGKVDVQVTIDESGRVISAHAMSGHVLLRPAAETAARRARFSPTLLSEVPVKVTGVIVYNFIR
jgi:TonB family protein